MSSDRDLVPKTGKAIVALDDESQNYKSNFFNQSRNNHALRHNLNPRYVHVGMLKPLGRATRKHSPGQVRKLCESVQAFGFVVPIVVDENLRVIAGWGLVLAARKMNVETVPIVILSDLTEAELRSLRLALNRLGEDSSWDRSELALEFNEIIELDINFELMATGFEMGEIDVLLAGDGADEEDEIPAPSDSVLLTYPGDLWILGGHRILCGDALSKTSYETLLCGERVQMLFSDPPYNVPIEGNVSGLGTKVHGEFLMASGEMSPMQFQAFLNKPFSLASDYSCDGAIHFICMDWRHLRELTAAGESIYSELKNLCVWNKNNAGMGSLYRSKHELVFVYKVGGAAHINNVKLGKNGRNRTNVWDYAGQTALAGRKNKLSLHPTVKPVAMVADAIRDCSHRGGFILDPFGGAGTTLIAAERTGRFARLIEIDPKYVDVTVRRWENLYRM